MSRAKIKLVYRQVIDESCATGFEKAIFQASYDEFLLKSQAYNNQGKFKTFSKTKANDGRANSLHYKLGFSVGHFIAELNNKIPVIKDNQGNKISFDVANFCSRSSVVNCLLEVSPPRSRYTLLNKDW